MQALPPKVPDFVRMGVSSERSRQRVKNSRSCGGGGGSRMMNLVLAMLNSVFSKCKVILSYTWKWSSGEKPGQGTQILEYTNQHKVNAWGRPGAQSVVAKYVHQIWLVNCIIYTIKIHLYPYDCFDCMESIFERSLLKISYYDCGFIKFTHWLYRL